MRLLRYRFDTLAQVSRHFHLANGRALLFYPSLIELRPGEAVLLDTTFVDSDQHFPLRGSVLGKDGSARHAGFWLEFPAHALVASLRTTLATPRRRLRRFPTEIVVNVERSGGMPVIAKLVDVGLGGGRLAGAGIRTAVGEKLQLSLFVRGPGSPVVSGYVAWTNGAEIGIVFLDLSPAERLTIGAVIDEVRRALTDAYQTTHPANCRCLSGAAVAEPSLPRAAHRQTASF